MHPTAMSNCQSFFTAYSASFAQHQHVKVVEIGSQNVNGTLRDTCPANFEYIGVDFAQAKGVDIVLEDPYNCRLKTNRWTLFCPARVLSILKCFGWFFWKYFGY